MTEDAERILANWIDEANSSIGRLPPGITPAQWAARKFVRWWRTDVESEIDDALSRAQRSLKLICSELQRLSRMSEIEAAFHECAHVGDALHELRATILPMSLDGEAPSELTPRN